MAQARRGVPGVAPRAGTVLRLTRGASFAAQRGIPEGPGPAQSLVGGDYAPAPAVWHNVTATTRAAGPSLTRGAGYR